MSTRARAAALVTAAVLGVATGRLDAQSTARPAAGITTPKAQFGFDIGDDYQLATYRQLVEYWRKLDAQSDRLSVVDIGRTAEGRPQLMAIVTAPENHKRLSRYQEITRRLTLAEGLTDVQARALAGEGKAVVWIDGGLHANEVLGAQQLIETSYRLVAGEDEETRRILRDVVILLVHANPDGHDLVADWYLRHADPLRRSTANLPRLYQKYIGHDNNRDSYMSTQPESTNMNRVLYREWFPQILYNHHQTGPSGTVLFAPPFRDPFNYVFDPLVPVGIDLVGAAMHQRFIAENKPGATMRRGANYSTWWNGGLRTTAYYHNMIGLLTEAIGHPTPMAIPFVPSRAIASGDLPFPIAPQPWHFRQSIEYEVTANMAVLDVASRHRETFLYNAYLMGQRSIARGSTDTWTVTPRRIARVRQHAGDRDGAGVSPATTVGGRLAEVPPSLASLLREPADRDPRGYILTAAQRDFPTAIKFANTLMKTGVTVHRATARFSVNGKDYPAGSIVVKAAQAFRPHVLDMFEPQDHPHDVAYPGGPPIPPYDSAGWTLAYQMGIEFDRVLEAFDGPFERLATFIEPTATVAPLDDPAGFLLSAAENDAARAVNRLLAAGARVSRYPQHADGAGTWFVEGAAAAGVVARAARELGISVTPVAARPAGESVPVAKARIGLVDEYGGSMPSGWIRWLLEQYEFPFEVVFPPGLDRGGLHERYDVLIVADDLIPPPGRPAGASSLDPATVPEPYRSHIGRVTAERTIPALQAFLDGGGTIVAIGPSTALAAHLRLPITSALVARTPTGDRPFRAEEYYIPGSVLRVRVDPAQPLAWGMPPQADVYFHNSPVFRLAPDAAARGVTPIAWFDTPAPLRSGWAWGQHHLEGGVAIAEARVGKGRLIVSGPEITFRAQPHGTFKFLFNALTRTP
jgi:hypothetical protein